MPILFRDYETRSTIDLRRVGAYKYAAHASTDVWCCAYVVDDGPINLWTPGMDIPAEFIEAARNPDWLVSAFNDAFERRIEQHIMAPRYGWPLIPIERHRCSQASALAHSLPAKLERVADALQLGAQKDAVGQRLMRQMSLPRRPGADEDPDGTYWFDDEKRKARLYTYCKQDVAVERELHKRIGFIGDAEQKVWMLDAIINDRGVYFDGKLLAGALRIAKEAGAEIIQELTQTTNGAVTSVSQVDRMISWLAERDCAVNNLRKPTLKTVLARADLPADIRRTLELRLEGASASARKLVTMQNWRADDGRARGTLRYHGASTGRWASSGIQVQNLKRPIVSDMASAIAVVSTGDLQRVKQAFPDPMSVVGDIGRAVICAAPGSRLLAADFSGIESRGTAWLSGEQSKVDQWAKFDQTGNPEDEPYYILGKRLGQPDETARSIGKTADLAFGYMGSVGAWQVLAPNDNSSEEQIQRYKQGWRDEHPETVKFWKMLTAASVRAVRRPEMAVACGRVSFTYDGTFLRMRLPSGRDIAYPFPRLHTNERGDCVVIFKDNAKGKWVDCRNGEGAYGGTWIENAVQAVARDLFADAMPRLEAAGYPIVLHVHDEIVCEAPIGVGSIEEFHKLMITPPAWADGLPIAAKARNGARFAKIELPRARQSCANTTPEPEIPQQNEQTPPWDGAGKSDDMREQEQPAREQPRGDGRDYGYPHGEEERGRAATAFVYRTADGKPYLQVRKFEVFENGKRRKSFPQYHQENGRWVKGKPAGPRIPYRLPELLAAPPDAVIDIMEGEKDADRGAELGLITTTNPEGAGKWGAELNEYFRGRRVRLHEDNDDAGRAHVAKVTNALHGVASDIRVVRYPELPANSDFSDFMDAGGTIEAMVARAEKAAPHPGYTLVRAEDVIVKPLDWLWPGHLLRGSLELMAGQPGQGKSQSHCSFARSVTTGSPWPDGAAGVQPGKVIMMTSEDTLSQILVPRLKFAGADLTRVRFLTSIRKDNKDRRFLIGEDIEALGRAVVAEGAQLVMIDPITAYMGGKLDSHRTTDVRDQLGPLSELAERTNVAIAAITHPPKNAGASALNHFIGSQAFIAAARIGHLTLPEMDQDNSGVTRPTGRFLFTNPKNNVSRLMPAIAYRIVAERPDDPQSISKVVWEDTITISADEAIAAATPKKDKDQHGAKPFLLDMLANGPVPKSIIDERAKVRGFTPDQLRRARESMGVVTFKGGFEGGWLWSLPQHAPKDAKPCD
jgi:DNA polymerase